MSATLAGIGGECRDLLGSIYPENFTIEKNEFRTARINEVVPIIYLINSILDKNKNGTRKNLSSLSHQVTTMGFEPIRLSAPPPQDGKSTSFSTWPFWYKQKKLSAVLNFLVTRLGFEPRTPSLKVMCSTS
jgi:hypothetical protein